MIRRSARAHAAVLVALTFALAACATDSASSPTPTASLEPMSEAPTPSDDVTTSPGATESPGLTPTHETTPTADPTSDDPLLAFALTDVRSGESFTLFELATEQGPVLLEPMAIWCSNCRAQQHQVVEAHANGEFTSVSLDVDLSEVPEDLSAYADREGFDWRFAMADAELYRLLQERFGVGATNPPSTPLIVIEADGSVRPLDFGVGTRSAERLLAELGQG